MSTNDHIHEAHGAHSKRTEYRQVIEALIFVSGDEGIEARVIAELLHLSIGEVRAIITDIQDQFQATMRGIRVVEVAGSYQMTTLPEHGAYFERLASSPNHATLSQAALETLAIIAYKQPITRTEIEEIRGVKCEKAIQTLVGKRLVEEKGRAEAVGRPILYGTTKEFMEYFGLRSISDLPPVPSVEVDESVEQEAEMLFTKTKEQA